MTRADADVATAIAVVGGVYRERCLRPGWQEVFGSGGRAASAIAVMGHPVALHCYLEPLAEEVLTNRSALEGFGLDPQPTPRAFTFEYTHGLATPRIHGDAGMEPGLTVEHPNVVCFGMLEGDPVVHGRRVVYDPQNPREPNPFAASGSTADEVAVVLNEREARLLSGVHDMDAEGVAQKLIDDGQAQVVVIKQGPMGVLVHDGMQAARVPAYRSNAVWKLGSGDVFVAHFGLRWLGERRSAAESADLASRAASYYCQTRGFPTPSLLESFDAQPITPSQPWLSGKRPKVYLAGPFFTLGQLWMVEQARDALQALGLNVFSPYHDVGLGSAAEVVTEDLEGIHRSDIVYAIGDGMDPGTVFEIGYARAMGKPVIVYSENESEEARKMMEGSDCLISDDFVTSIYETAWAACVSE